MRKVGEEMLFSGGAETTLLAKVDRFYCRESKHHGDKTLVIMQGNQQVSISVATLLSMLEWAWEDPALDKIAGVCDKYRKLNQVKE